MTLATRLAIAMVLLVAIAVSAVGWLSYRSLERAVLPRVLDRIETHSRLVASDFESYVAGARGDVAGFRSAAALDGLIRAHLAGGIDAVDGVSEATWRERVASRIAAELEAKPSYAVFRIIGVEDGGREIVRADRSGPGGAVRLTPREELLQRGERGYFKETIKLRPGEIYVSALDLMVAKEAIETPLRPVLRVAAPIFTPDGKPFGIVIANVDMRPALFRVRSSVRPGEAIYVVNSRGDYLLHPDPAREFASLLNKGGKWQDDFPYLVASIGARQGLARMVADQAGEAGGVALAPAMLAGREWVGIIETIPNAVFMAPAASIAHTSLLVGLIAVICAAALAVFIANSLTRPIRQLTTAVEGAGKNGSVAIPINASGETGVLARAFARVLEEANAKTAALQREVLEHRRTEAARDHHAARARHFSAAVESSNDAIIT